MILRAAEAPGLLTRALRVFTGHDGDAGRFLTAEGALAFLAASDDVIEGWCWGYHIVRPDASSMAYLHELDVVEACRRRGIGRQLVQAFMEAASSLVASKMFLNAGLNNLGARKLYEDLGGRLAEQGEVVSYWFDFPPSTGAPSER
jgi:ribosomal protein S18 acetylase RimI-like enzyme